ncbi:DUF2927 domain-containing protein [Shewanella litorisediminis]|uniref:DUF2927 domain-containing protein n=1 Tax=Shewanella litorisediminis TaxID=1173586 RepID=A0ABX7G125_9GAMM|nr:DUF2927 domain-containing protein [Shewanella litorisediminis]MCL2918909.1 DUF2927 domain-containing protein [Shewanella litorisediminis]QRH00981.1 DUF2927 domain-containing protein [Shewanella litorisediminis]
MSTGWFYRLLRPAALRPGTGVALQPRAVTVTAVPLAGLLLTGLLVIATASAKPLATDFEPGAGNHLNPGYVARSFAAIVHGREYEAGSFPLSKWVGEIRFAIEEQVQEPVQRQLVLMHFKQLGELTGLRIREVGVKEANLHILFTRQRDWEGEVKRRLGAKAAANLHGAVCLAHFEAPGGVIRRAQVFIPVDQARMHGKLVSCVVEELTQVLGLPNDSEAIFPSVFNDKAAADLLTPMDWVLIRLLYQDALKPGMSRTQTAPIIAEQLAIWLADGTLASAESEVRRGELYRLLGR